MKNEVSFTNRVKEEVTSLSFEDIKQRTMLSAFTKMNGELKMLNGEDKLILHTENSKIAKFIFLNFQKRYKVSPRFAYLKNMHFNKNITYQVIIEQKIDEILKDLELLYYEGNTKSFVRSEESLHGFLCGAFLASGSVNSPISSNYHLEISTPDLDLANYINNIFSRVKVVSFSSKMIKRRNRYVVYLKRSEQIVDFLKLIGAIDECLYYEHERTERDYDNNDNRLQICEDANMFRAIASARKQIEDIKYIDKVLGINNIANKKLKLLVELRLKYEGASMNELADLMSEILEKTVSKSSVNHMFRALKELADKYRGVNHE